MGKVPALQARRRGHHRGGGDLRLPRRRISARQAQRAGRRSAPRRLSQMAVLRAELHRAGDHGSRRSRARRRRAAARWATADFDTVMDVVAKAVAKGPYLMGEQFTAADVVIGSGLRWGMHVQAAARAARVPRLYRPPGGTPGAATRGSQGQGAGGGVTAVAVRAAHPGPGRCRISLTLHSGYARSG